MKRVQTPSTDLFEHISGLNTSRYFLMKYSVAECTNM